MTTDRDKYIALLDEFTTFTEAIRSALIEDGWSEVNGRLVAPATASPLAITVARLLADIDAIDG